MTESGERTFVGFGFGPIQNALFLFEAYMSGNFSRYVVAEIDADLVVALRESGGRYHVNIARAAGIDVAEVAGVELLNPREPAERERIVGAVAAADELATALPSVTFYGAGGAESVAGTIAEGLARRASPKPTVIYAAENHNHAAEILREQIERFAPADALRKVQALNTVVGKMSGVIADAETIARLGLTTITPGIPRAILIEHFNRILISRITLAEFRRGIDVFVEKDDLLPFEEAKLYGHNAIHALIAYLADRKGLATIADAGRDEEIMRIARSAFIDESGAALIGRNGHTGDPLFTRDGYRDYADDLLARMVNPYLNDLVARVGRDPVRKLGYDDRLYGTMRLALASGVRPANLALGAAAGVLSMIARRAQLSDPPASLPAHVDALDRAALAALLGEIWADKADEQAPALVELTWDALRRLA